ncbi:S8 family serine peptidase [Salinarimonas chemoclinalis]|uniref:S8 family serine peptidase n=1 Tax=Salinarimonas chemoclinalis TaxID=3241599 RepID=UPI003557F285
MTADRMNDDPPEGIDADDPALLLPWHAAGTLDAGDRARVERFLADNPEQQAHLAAIAEEREATVVLARAAPVPGAGSIDAILAQARREAPRAAAGAIPSAAAARRGFAARALAGLSGLLDALSPPLRGAAIAALVLLAVAQAGVIGGLVGAPPAETTFRTATGDGAAAPVRASILVVFAPEATAGAIGDLLAALDARIVDGPRAGGLYALALPEGSDADAALARLRDAGDVVRFAGPGS